jgi:hypothetical protein
MQELVSGGSMFMDAEAFRGETRCSRADFINVRKVCVVRKGCTIRGVCRVYRVRESA